MITLARVGDVVRFTFQDNPLYLNDGTIEVPVNSLSLLIDESNIATFKKAASNDIFLSCSLDELGMSKEQLINWYKDNMVDEGITPEEVEDIVESATVNLFGYAEYDSQNTRINFKHDANGSVISSIDASDFVIDGMIDNVEIVTVEDVKYLKITFNTESGKEPILIPLADIFNPDNYYTKTATDALLAEKANTATTYTKTEVDNAISAATSGKADADDVYTKTEVDNAISAATSGKVDTDVFDEKERAVSIALNDLEDRKLDASAYTPTDLSNYYTKSETDGEIEEAVSGKADTTAVTQAISAAVSGKADTSAVTEAISAAVSGKADSDSVYTKTEIDSALSGKQDTLVAGTNITISGNVISAEGGGKELSAGTNISITTGETADTINCTLPITVTNSDNNSKQSIAIGDGSSAHISNFYDSIAIGKNSKGYFGSIIIGSNPTAYSQGNGLNVAIGNGTKFYDNSVIIGDYAEGYNGFNANSVAIGQLAEAKNIKGAVAIGHRVTTTGTTKTNINNQLRIDTSNQVYIYNKDNTEMICLQDALGGGGSSYTAGDGIDITNDVISVTGKVDTSAITTSMTSGSTDSQVPSAKAVYDNFGGLKLVKLTTAQYNALLVKDPMTLYVIADDVVCTPESDIWVRVDDNFTNFSAPVYNLNFSEMINLIDLSMQDVSWFDITVDLYEDPVDATNFYQVDARFDVAVPDEVSIAVYDKNGTSLIDQVIYNEVDLCQLIGSGLYLHSNDGIPSVDICAGRECVEYECLQEDEETGECIEEGECTRTECTNEVTIYPLEVKQ